MQINFDLDEFIAYLLYGALLLAALSSVFALNISSIYPSFAAAGSTVDAATKILLLGALIFVAGHACSVVSRQITRRLIWSVTKRPREQIFSNNHNGYWDTKSKEIFRKKLKDQIYTNVTLPSEKELKRTAPRLVRSYVLARSPAFVDVRSRIVRSRSMCANAVLPLTILCYVNYSSGQTTMAIALALATVLMLVKQHDLDVREWKEVYAFFVAVTDEPKRNIPEADTQTDPTAGKEVLGEQRD